MTETKNYMINKKTLYQSLLEHYNDIYDYELETLSILAESECPSDMVDAQKVYCDLLRIKIDELVNLISHISKIINRLTGNI